VYNFNFWLFRVVIRFMGAVGEQMVRAYNFLWGGHRGFGKNQKRFIISEIGVRSSITMRGVVR